MDDDLFLLYSSSLAVLGFALFEHRPAIFVLFVLVFALFKHRFAAFVLSILDLVLVFAPFKHILA